MSVTEHELTAIEFPVPMVGFAAFSGTSKTTLLLALVRCSRPPVCASPWSNAHHSFEMDQPGRTAIVCVPPAPTRCWSRHVAVSAGSASAGQEMMSLDCRRCWRCSIPVAWIWCWSRLQRPGHSED